MSSERFRLELPIIVTKLVDRGQYRAVTQFSGETFVGAGRDSPVEAVKILLAQLSGVSGSYGDKAEVAFELLVFGTDSIESLLALPNGDHKDD